MPEHSRRWEGKVGRRIELSRVVVTGLGALTPSGLGVPTNWEAALCGKSGIGPITSFDPTGLETTIAGEVRDFDPKLHVPGKGRTRTDRAGQFALTVVREALTDAGLLNGDGVVPDEYARAAGVAMGNGAGNLHKTFEVDAKIRAGSTNVGMAVVPFLPDSTTYACSILYNLQGPALHPVKACATGAAAIGQSFWDIATGRAKIMVAGATEAPICRFGLVGFSSINALSRRNDDPTRASRPFDRDRDGFVMSEGAGCLVLEEHEHARARGARIYAEVLGYASNMDARDWTRPNCERQVQAILGALADAELRPGDVGYLNAHATATLDGDPIEAEAIRTAFPDHWRDLPVSASKSVFGHTLGAAGAIAAVMTVLTLATGRAHPTHNLENVGAGCDLCHLTRAEQIDPRAALSLSFGFGGQNVVLAFGRYEG